MAGTLGTKKLSTVSSQLESALKKEKRHGLSNLLDRFSGETARVMAALDEFEKKERATQTGTKAILKEPPAHPPRAYDSPRLQTLFQELSDAIDEHDADVIRRVSEIKTLLGPSNINEGFLNLESLLNSFKFEQAQEVLEGVAKGLGL